MKVGCSSNFGFYWENKDPLFLLIFSYDFRLFTWNCFGENLVCKSHLTLPIVLWFTFKFNGLHRIVYLCWIVIYQKIVADVVYVLNLFHLFLFVKSAIVISMLFVFAVWTFVFKLRRFYTLILSLLLNLQLWSYFF